VELLEVDISRSAAQLRQIAGQRLASTSRVRGRKEGCGAQGIQGWRGMPG